MRNGFVRREALAAEHQRVGFFAPLGKQRHQTLGHDARNAFSQADVGQQFGARAAAGKTQKLVPERLVFGIVCRQLAETLGTQCLSQQLFA